MAMDLTQGGNFAILPAFIRYDKNLTDSEKLLYCELTALSNKHGYCYAGNKYLSELYGVTKETISRRLSRLEKKGYVKIYLQRDGKEITGRHIYPMTDPSIPIDANVNTPHDATVKTPIDANVKENNLSTNNLSINKLNYNKERVGVIFDKYTELGFGAMNGYLSEQIHNWLETFEPEVIVRAMEIASNNNKATMAYINGILQNWKNRDLTTIEKINAEEKKRDLEKQAGPQTYQQKMKERPGEAAPEWMNKKKEAEPDKKPLKQAADDPEIAKMINDFRSKNI